MKTTPEDKEANYERVSEIVHEIYSKPDAWPLVSCPCRIDESEIVYCPIHKAAPDLLAALKGVASFAEDGGLDTVKNERWGAVIAAIRKAETDDN